MVVFDKKEVRIIVDKDFTGIWAVRNNAELLLSFAGKLPVRGFINFDDLSSEEKSRVESAIGESHLSGCTIAKEAQFTICSDANFDLLVGGKPVRLTLDTDPQYPFTADTLGKTVAVDQKT